MKPMATMEAMVRQHKRQSPITNVMSTAWGSRNIAMLRQQGLGVKGVPHSTDAIALARIDSAQISPAFFDSGSWPSAPLVEWPPSVLELYFAWLVVEYEVEAQ